MAFVDVGVLNSGFGLDPGVLVVVWDLGVHGLDTGVLGLDIFDVDVDGLFAVDIDGLGGESSNKLDLKTVIFTSQNLK